MKRVISFIIINFIDENEDDDENKRQLSALFV